MTPKQMVEILDGQLIDCYAEISEKQGRIAELETALLLMVNHEVNYMYLNNLGDPEAQHRIKQARAALKAKP